MYTQAHADFESKTTFKEIEYQVSHLREKESTCWCVIKWGMNHGTHTCHLILIITREQEYIIISSQDKKHTSHHIIACLNKFNTHSKSSSSSYMFIILIPFIYACTYHCWTTTTPIHRVPTYDELNLMKDCLRTSIYKDQVRM